MQFNLYFFSALLEIGYRSISESRSIVFGYINIFPDNFCGTPATTQLSGTSFTTTALAPINTLLPILAGPNTLAPADICTLSPMTGNNSYHSLLATYGNTLTDTPIFSDDYTCMNHQSNAAVVEFCSSPNDTTCR